MEEQAYILGTDPEELYRLGVQHYAWAEQTQAAWRRAHLSPGQTVLELGCGPGFCTRELAYAVGQSGRVIAVDQSKNYLHYINSQIDNPYLNIETLEQKFEALRADELPAFDLFYSRWAIAWTDTYETVLDTCISRMKPQARLVFHEYYKWGEHCAPPQYKALNFAIGKCLESFNDSPGEINVGALLPPLLRKHGLQVDLRPLKQLVTPKSKAWDWPISYYKTYIPRLVTMDYLTAEQAAAALEEVAQLEQDPNAYINCPLVAELIAYR